MAAPLLYPVAGSWKVITGTVIGLSKDLYPVTSSALLGSSSETLSKLSISMDSFLMGSDSIS